jgi:hypothetical protein
VSTYAHQLTTVDEQRYRPDFPPAFNAWMATNPLDSPDAPSSPFVMSEHAFPEIALANQLDVEAGDLFDEVEDANQHADDYGLNTVVLAGVLMFVGRAPVFAGSRRGPRSPAWRSRVSPSASTASPPTRPNELGRLPTAITESRSPVRRGLMGRHVVRRRGAGRLAPPLVAPSGMAERTRFRDAAGA